jgi:hypothetical protein
MTHITWILHLDNGEEHTFYVEKCNMTFTGDITDKKAEELWEEMDEIIELA